MSSSFEGAKYSMPKSIYCTTFEKSMASISMREHFLILGYIYGKQERPAEYIRAGIQSAKFEVKKIDIAISHLGFCLFGEKGREKRRLKREKAKWLEYISLLNEVMYFTSPNDLVKSVALLKKYAEVTKFRVSGGAVGQTANNDPYFNDPSIRVNWRD